MRQFYQSVLTFLLCCKHRDLPWQFWFFIVLIPVYIISPIDIIPDGTKYFGYWDDLFVSYVLFIIAYHRISDSLWFTCKDRAESYMAQGLRKTWPAAILLLLMIAFFIYVIIVMYG